MERYITLIRNEKTNPEIDQIIKVMTDKIQRYDDMIHRSNAIERQTDQSEWFVDESINTNNRDKDKFGVDSWNFEKFIAMTDMMGILSVVKTIKPN